MALSHLLSIFLLWTLLISTLTTAFDITKILEQYPDYEQFSELLTKTDVAKQINKRKSITVLAIPNSAMSGVGDKDDESLEILMRLHVVQDYLDSEKIKALEDDAQLRTLYPATGSAGLLTVKKDDNNIKLISAVGSSGSGSARVTKVVTSIPSEVSVLEVSNALTSSESDGGNSPVSPTPSSDSPPAPSPPEQKESPPPTPSPAEDDNLDSDDNKDGAGALPDGDGEELDKASDVDEVPPSSSPRNAVVSGFLLMASLFAML